MDDMNYLIAIIVARQTAHWPETKEGLLNFIPICSRLIEEF
tara:strand:+ start:685 stop:807 length:123 start_codon:yes stop_codon:yes gene_type:complete